MPLGAVRRHMAVLLGEPMKRFLEDLRESFCAAPGYRVHFASAREAANIVFAALDDRDGDPGPFRDYRYVPLARSGG